LRRNGVATTSFTQADIDAGRITYQHNGSATTSDSFSFTVNDGQGTSTNGTFNISIVSSTGETDSFESGDPTGWDDGMWSVTGSLGLTTTTAVTPPPGGGTHVLQQHWASSSTPDWLRHEFDSPLDHGDMVEISYYIMYHPNFVFYPAPGQATMKMIIFQTEVAGERSAALYFDAYHGNGGGHMAFHVTGTNEVPTLQANTNGGPYDLPVGQWVHVRCQVKVAQEGGAQDGHIKVWINGTQRWNHTNIYTGGPGEEITSFELNPTYNSYPPGGTNQKRYWDMISVSTTRAASGQALPSSNALQPAMLHSTGYDNSGVTTTDKRQPFDQIRRTRFNNVIPSETVSGAKPSLTLLTIHAVIDSSQSSDSDGILQVDDERDLIFERLGESPSHLEESWLDLL
jgi:hypothetical protein